MKYLIFHVEVCNWIVISDTIDYWIITCRKKKTSSEMLKIPILLNSVELIGQLG